MSYAARSISASLHRLAVLGLIAATGGCFGRDTVTTETGDEYDSAYGTDTKHDANTDTNPNPDDSDSGDPGGGSSVVCRGVAYTRTDVPGTAICLDAAASFSCGWGTGNPAVDGYRVQGDHDPANNTLTLWFPDDPSNTAFTPFVFDMLYDLGGVDLVLYFMGGRTGDYRQVGSWAEAAAGDFGLCGGATTGGGGGDDTCQQPCTTNSDCNAGQACFSTEPGTICLPAGCGGCFDSASSCNFSGLSCTFSACGPADPDASDTCRQPCDPNASDCNQGEVCADTLNGNICLPAGCLGCFDSDLSCSSNSSTCEFLGCT